MFARSPLNRLRRSVLPLLVPTSLCVAALSTSAADPYPPPAATDYPANSLAPVTPPDNASLAAAQPQYLNPIQLHELVARIALYPDDLIGIILPASTVPLQIVQAARYLEAVKADPSLKPDDAWEDAVVALLNYPDVIAMMDRDFTWTERLGNAVVQQQADVITAVSQFRAQAQQAGNLRSDERQIVDTDQGAIRIRPADPQVIYVPQYEPTQVLVYQPVPVLSYYPRPCPVYYYPYDRGYPSGFPYFWGVSSAFSIGWHTHVVHVHEHAHYDDDYYDHPYRGHHYRRRHHRHDDDHHGGRRGDHHHAYDRDRPAGHDRGDHPRGQRPDRGRDYVWEPPRGRAGRPRPPRSNGESRPPAVATTGHPTMLGNVGTTDPRNITLAPLMGGPRGEPQLPPRPMARTLRNEPERAAVPRTPAFAIPPVPRLPQQARALGQAPSRPTAPPDGRAVTVTPARPPASGIMVPGASFGGYLPQQASPPREAQPERRSVPRSPAFAIPQAPRLPQQARALEQAPVRRPAAPASRATAVAPLRVPASGIMVPGTSLGGYAPQRAPSPRDALPERRARAAEIEVPRGYSMPTPVERPTYESPRESRSQRDFSRAAPRVSRPEARIDGARAWSSMQRAAERRVTERRRDR